jgi:hypothetical protein
MLLETPRSAARPLLSDDLQAVIGLAVVDGGFQQQLLAEPKHAVARLGLGPRDRRAAAAIRGASSLAEYAVLLEQRLAVRRRQAGAGQPSPGMQKAG